MSSRHGYSGAGHGGAVYVTQGGSSVFIADSVFESCKAQIGGAVLIWGGNSAKKGGWSTVQIRNSSFIRNAAVHIKADQTSGAGGGLDLQRVNAVEFDSRVKPFVNNTAHRDTQYDLLGGDALRITRAPEL